MDAECLKGRTPRSLLAKRLENVRDDIDENVKRTEDDGSDGVKESSAADRKLKRCIDEAIKTGASAHLSSVSYRAL
jgi:hypothetical protein